MINKPVDHIKNRIQWVDILKGIGIMAVVFGHYYTERFPYIFHMPLFFIASGFFAKYTPPRQLAIKTFQRLIIPYLSFVVIFILIKLSLGERIPYYGILYGGKHLTGDFGVFWFVPVLFMSLNLYNLLSRSRFAAYMFILFGLSSMIFSGYLPDLPYNLEVVPMAVCLIYVGQYSFNIFQNIKIKNPTLTIIIITGVIISAIIFKYSMFLYIDMKYGLYGIPVISMIVALYLILIISCLSFRLQKTTIGYFIAYIGEASMMIMFLHNPILRRTIFMEDVSIMISIVVPILLYSICNKSRFFSPLLIGRKSKILTSIDNQYNY